MTAQTVAIRIENTYEDGHVSRHEVIVPAPELGELEDWWQDEVFEHTGDGHGAEHPKLGVWYEATIVAGPAELVGKTCEWD